MLRFVCQNGNNGRHHFLHTHLMNGKLRLCTLTHYRSSSVLVSSSLFLSKSLISLDANTLFLPFGWEGLFISEVAGGGGFFFFSSRRVGHQVL